MSDLVTDEYLDYVDDGSGGTMLGDIRKYIKDATAADIQAVISGGIVDPSTQSAWTIPYNRPANPSPPAAPTGFKVTMVTANSPSFSWDAITDSSVVGVMIYFAVYSSTAAPRWKNWTYVVPVSVTQFSEPFTLDPGTYVFAISAINSDGAESAMSMAGTQVKVV